MSEAWFADNMFCPYCGNAKVEPFDNNKPVADFFCPSCANEYELKSKAKAMGVKIVDGAYASMITRIESTSNPNFFFLNYLPDTLKVQNLIFIPKFFFTPSIIEKRPPLKSTARRAGWVGCNILFTGIPLQGRIPIITQGDILPKRYIIKMVEQSKLLETKILSARGWLLDVLSCINRIPKNDFLLKDLYVFEFELADKHPMNNNIKAKIRQQLQFLRDKGFIIFVKDGQYKKIL